MIKPFKFFDGDWQQPPLEPTPILDILPNGEWGILYRDRNNNLLLDNVRLDGLEYSHDDWFTYDTGFITMDYFFNTYFNDMIAPVVRSIEHNGYTYDIRFQEHRRIINSYIWEPTDMVRIIGKR
jgi:hypothetical protein